MAVSENLTSVLQVLARINAAFTSQASFEDAIRLAAGEIRRYCSADAVIVLQQHDQTANYVIRARVGAAEIWPEVVSLEESDPLAALVRNCNKQTIPVEQLALVGNDSLKGTCLGIPLVWEAALVGIVLILWSDDADRDRFEVALDSLVMPLAAALAVAKRTQALEIERESVLHIQIAARHMLEQPDVQENLLEVAEAIQALGWREVRLAICGRDREPAQFIFVGVDAERLTACTQILPQRILEQLQAGELEHCRFSGCYLIPDRDPESDRWHSDDILFAPLRSSYLELTGIIRVGNPVNGLRPSPAMMRPLDILASQTAYMVENTWLLAETSATAEQLAEQVDELSMIHRADRELSANLNTDRVMTLTMDWALRRTGAQGGILTLVTEDGHGLVPLVTMGGLASRLPTFSEHNPWPVEQGLIGKAASEGCVQIARRSDSELELMVPQGASALMAVPLRMRGEILGVIALLSEQATAFDENDVSFMERLARRAAVALDNARLFRQSEQLADDMASLYDASRAITSTLDREKMLNRMAYSMVAMLDCSSAILLDFQPDAKSVSVIALYRNENVRTLEQLPDLRQVLSLDEFPALRKAVEQRCLIVANRVDGITVPDEVDALTDGYLQKNRMQAVILLPLIAQNELIGLAMLVEGRHERRFSPGEISKAESLANQAAVALRQALLYSEVLELEKLKSEMIRMASHDLRNPLNNLTGYVELLAMSLEEFGMTPDQAMYIDNLRRSTTIMKSLIEDLLTLERIESERDAEWQTFDLAGLVTEVVESLQSSADLKRHSLIFESGREEMPYFGSVTQLRQVIANLIENAIKYTPEAGQIRIGLRQDENRIDFLVEDNGYGIAPERQGRIFERFYRAQEPGTDHIVGTGLGLSLVKAVIERHGGRVWFSSVPGKGSTFGITLVSRTMRQ